MADFLVNSAWGSRHNRLSLLMVFSAILANPATTTPLPLPEAAAFPQLVNEALRNYGSTLALSRSALANSALVTPTLVKDEASPTAEERGHGLRLVIQWAVNQLAPGPPTYPLAVYRPLDDPTWRDPRWWRYNILRHRYLEPLHPDDFIAGGRYTESLLALTGISSTDALFDERNRAIREVADRLRQQLLDGQANAELRQLALQEIMTPLQRERRVAQLLGIAACFDEIFPRTLLLNIATEEGLRDPARLVDAAVAQRLLLTGDQGANLWLSPVLRAYLYEREPRDGRQRRHRWAAGYYAQQGAPLAAARHWQRAGQDGRAVQLLLPAVEELVRELQLKELIELLQRLETPRLAPDQHYAVQLLLCDLCQRSGNHEAALAACRRGLKSSATPTDEARIYRRMGKLYESRNQLHALRYYQQALERFPASDPEVADLLKDRGWLYFLRQEWQNAEADWQRALQATPETAQLLRGDLLDAMANLSRKTGDHNRAVAYAEQALVIREQAGDLLQIAKSHGNLGLLYRAMGEYRHAIAAYREAITTYQKIGNQELVAVALLNIGVAHHLDQKLADALAAYQQSLAICQAIDLPLIELKAHYNLAEALALLGRQEAATQHWQAGYLICRQHHFDDQEADFLALRELIPSLAAADATNPSPLPTPTTSPPAVALDAEEIDIVMLAQREQSLTPKRLMQIANISRATATRRLSALVEKGVLEKLGEGRGTYYRVLTLSLGVAPTPPAPATVQNVRQVLQLCQQELQERYGVAALGLLALPTTMPLARLVVQFHQPPDLATYWAVKQQLDQLLQTVVELTPHALASPAGLAPQGIDWLWDARP